MANILIINLPLAIGIDGSEFVAIDQSDGRGGFVTKRTTTEAIADLANTPKPLLNPGTYGSATQIPQVTVDSSGRVTHAVNISPTVFSGTVSSVGLAAPAQFAVSGSPITIAGTLSFDWVTPPTGTGAVVLAGSPSLVTPNIGAATGTSLQLSGLSPSSALATDASSNLVSFSNTGTGNNVLATNPVLTAPNLGTPSAVTLTNGTGLPVSTGISGFGTGVATFLATPSSANLASAVTDETGSGSLVFGTSPTLTGATITSPAAITNVPTPSASGDAANKSYVDGLVGGNSARASCLYATAAALAANTYNNGALGVGATLTGNSNGAITVDGATPSVGARILVKNEVTAANNGIYTVTTVGSGGAAYVLTRATDYDQAAEITNGTYTYISAGTANINSTFALVTSGAVTVGTTALSFSLSNFGANYTAGTGITISPGFVVALNAAITGSGNFVQATSPTLVTPALGQPSALILTNATGLLDAGVLTGSKLYNRITDEASITDYGADRTGIVSAVTALNNALTAASRVVIPFGTFLIDATVTVAAGKTLVFEGGQFTITVGHSITLNNQSYVQAGRTRIVASASVGNFSNLKVAYPEWWGAVQSTTVTSNAAFISMLAALRTNGVADLDQGFYALDGTTALTASNGQIFQGKGSYATTIRFPTAAMNFVAYDTTIGGEIRNLRLANTAVTPTSGTLISFSTNNAAKARIEDLVVDNCFNFCSFIGTNVTTINDMRMSNFKVAGVQGRGLLLQWAENMWISNGIIDGVGNASPGMDWEDKVQGIYMSAVTVSNFNAAGMLVSNAAGAISRGLDARWNKLVECVFDDNQNGLDAVYMSDTEFTNCWFNSNGRISDRTIGQGARLRNVTSCRFVQCQFSNNGEHGVRLEAPCTFVRFSYCELFGDNVNNDGASGAWIEGDTSKWSFDHCDFGTGGGWSGIELHALIVNLGAGDYYTIADCMFAGCSGAPLVNSGSGVHQNTSTNNYTF